METIICIKCKQDKPVGDFYKDPRYKLGYKTACKACLNAQQQAWQKANPDKVRANNKRWRANHPEYAKAADSKPRKRIYDPVRQKFLRNRRNADATVKERINARARDRSRVLKEFLNAHKVAHGCCDCGYNAHPAALDFDHVVGTKNLNISFAKSKRQAMQEMEKCVIRCRNCHAIRHYKEGRLSDTNS